MRRSLAERSLLLFVIVFVVTLGQTLFASKIGAWSFGVQRWIIFLGIILPAGAGVVFGVLSLVRREGQTWVAILGIVLNTLFALFHLLIILFAG